MSTLNSVHDPAPLIWTGQRDVDLRDPSGSLDLREIAHGLSMRFRYGGFSDVPVTVLQHSLVCANLYVTTSAAAGIPLDNDTFRAVMMHDASEAYLGDVQRPLKKMPEMEGYRTLEKRFEDAIRREFMLPTDDATMRAVARVDALALAVEVDLCFPSAATRWVGLEPITYYDHVTVRNLLLDPPSVLAMRADFCRWVLDTMKAIPTGGSA